MPMARTRAARRREAQRRRQSVRPQSAVTRHRQRLAAHQAGPRFDPAMRRHHLVETGLSENLGNQQSHMVDVPAQLCFTGPPSATSAKLARSSRATCYVLHVQSCHSGPLAQRHRSFHVESGLSVYLHERGSGAGTPVLHQQQALACCFPARCSATSQRRPHDHPPAVCGQHGDVSLCVQHGDVHTATGTVATATH